MTDNNKISNEQGYDALALFSGGLDSILAAKLIEKQGLRVKCLHFTSPFFGYPDKVEHWQKVYGLDIATINIDNDYAKLLEYYPQYGFGSVLNPCVDCKILMMRHARALMQEYGAKFLISGEVLGQRPMSQRRDTLNVIRRDADAKDILLRPLCARLLDPTEVELNGLVDRTQLLSFSGRGRNPQLMLAEELGIQEIPTPAGGCKLTEKENAARYWQVLHYHNPKAENFHLANTGRQYWYKDKWLTIGRNKEDNALLETMVQEHDVVMRVLDFSSPLAIGRAKIGSDVWTDDVISVAASLLASYSPKAVQFAKEGNDVKVLVTKGNKEECLFVQPTRKTDFQETDWNITQKEVKVWTKEHQK